MPRLKTLMTFSLATSLFVPALFAQNTNSARPGTINYIEGQVMLNGQALTAKSVGNTELAPGHTISTANGKAEVLLTPGVFLRLDSDSAVTMVSPDLTKTEVQLNGGRAEIEVDQLYKQNDLLVDEGSAQAQLLKNGLYGFDATAGIVRVFDGEAVVSASQTATKWTKVKEGHQLALNGDATKTTDFNREQVASSDPLYSWSKLRANYLGQANLNLAREYAGNTSFNPGWAWDSDLYAYTWMPGDGLFWSPFGYGFYSPFYLSGGGFIYPGYGFRGGYYRGGYGYGGDYYRSGLVGGMRSAPAASFHGSAGFVGGAGLRGGGGFSGGSHGAGGRR